MINFSNHLAESTRVINSIYRNKDLILKAADLISGCLYSGGKLLWCGNGGSASEAQHMSAEYMVRFKENRAPFASVALTSDSALITAHANDFNYDTLFSRQIDGLGLEGDILIAISTSGKSENIIKGMETAKKNGLKILFLKGLGEAECVKYADITFSVDSLITARIQEGHTLINHLICECVEIMHKNSS